MSDLAPALPTGSTPPWSHRATPITVTDLEIRLSDGSVLLPKTSARIRAGHVTALMGDSGSGKTTLLRALVGHLPAGAAATGAVEVLGRTPHSCRPTSSASCGDMRSRTSGRTPAPPSTPA